MKIMDYREAPVQTYDGGAVKDVRGRVAIGKADGAERFCMRVFELGAGGFTPRHRHDWEHEIFFHAAPARCSGTAIGCPWPPAPWCSCPEARSIKSATPETIPWSSSA